MASLWMTFRECGFPAWAVFFASLLASAFGLLAAVFSLLRIRAAKVVAGVAFVLALSPLFLGSVGTIYLSNHLLDDAVSGESIEPLQAARLLAEGYRQANGCVSIGLGFTLLPLLLAGSALVIARAYPMTPATTPEA